MSGTAPTQVKHPAKFTPVILEEIERVLDERNVLGFVLDPFAGVGGVHSLAKPGRITLGVELEPEWARAHPDTICGDATDLHMLCDESIDCIVTSPPYGNRLADVDMRESAAVNYAKYLGRRSSEGSLNHVRWGNKFKRMLWPALYEMHRVLKRGGLLVFNFKDHPKNFVMVPATGECLTMLRAIGFAVLETRAVPVRGHTYGTNSHRAEYERVVVAVKR